MRPSTPVRCSKKVPPGALIFSKSTFRTQSNWLARFEKWRAGGSIIDPKVVETLVAALGDLVPESDASVATEVRSNGGARSDRPEPLTERELEVLRLVAAGDSNQEIARKLVVTLATVKTHINHIFSKLDAESRVQVVARARALGLLQS